ncbi:hypothetical protein PENVUL_c026G10153 [Penicillium vulpinum]|uniref:HTH CENPB-type domain-containing protein n=1 Tax=Penicillium vulpinum TaxID=29845 RepID=A0A1V6RUF3_9EURO|nr:hypothetical protein PENVUL_c026G10153 [Penicillium vulpinum]
MRDLHLPVTPEMLTEWANRALVRAGSNHEVSKIWSYRFEKRLPPYLMLGPVAQRTKDKKRLDAEDVGYPSSYLPTTATSLCAIGTWLAVLPWLSYHRPLPACASFLLKY